MLSTSEPIAATCPAVIFTFATEWAAAPGCRPPAVRCMANSGTSTMVSAAARYSGSTGETSEASRPTATGPNTKPSSSSMDSRLKAAVSVLGFWFCLRDMAIQRTLDIGPTCGPVAPASRLRATRVPTASSEPELANNVKVTSKMVCSTAAASSTGRCPRRSAR